MNHDQINDLKHPAPLPRDEVKETAWLSACCEFHRCLNSAPITRQKTHIEKWLWSLAAVASLGILCAIVFTTSDSPPQSTAEINSATEIEKVFLEGHQLFGNQLKAVSVSGDEITWHLHDAASSRPSPPQLVTLTIQDKNHPDVQLATYIGTPIDFEYRGETHELEFLPDATDKIIAYGKNIYWDSGSPTSPIIDARYTNLPTP